MWAGAKKWRPRTRDGSLTSPAIASRSRYDVLVARTASGGSDRLKRAEDRALDVHALERRLDGKRGPAGPTVIVRHGKPRAAFGSHVFTDQAARDACPDDARDIFGGPHDAVRIRLQERHAHPGVQKSVRNASAHRSTADHGNMIERRRLRRDTIRRTCTPFGKKDVAQRLCLIRRAKIDEGPPFRGQPVRHRATGKPLDQIDGGDRSDLLRHSGGDPLAGCRKRLRVCRRERPVINSHRSRKNVIPKGKRRRDRVLFQSVDQPKLQRPRCPDGPAARDHLKGRAISNEAREPLRAAGPGQDAQRDLGKPDLRLGRRNPVPTGKRQFRTAAERITAHGGDPGDW